MLFFKHFFLARLNVWAALLLLAANLYGWAAAVTDILGTRPYEVAPLRDPEVVAVLEKIEQGTHGGETWQVTLTELEAEQTITWYLQRYPQIPFEHPRLHITPDYVSGEGDATLGGLRVHVGGKVRITLAEGLPVVEILELSLPLPGPIRQAVEAELQAQLRRADQLAVRFTSAEWRNGEVVVTGVIR